MVKNSLLILISISILFLGLNAYGQTFDGGVKKMQE